MGRSKTKIVAIAVAIAFGLFVAALAFGVSVARFGNLPTGPPPPRNEHVQAIVMGLISVGADNYEYRQFKVPADAFSPIVRGNFFVNGTGDDDINVMILNETGFLQWQNNHSIPQSYYSSSDVITANLEADVPSGQTLYLVFDNTSSSNRAKNVNTDIELAYLQ